MLLKRKCVPEVVVARHAPPSQTRMSTELVPKGRHFIARQKLDTSGQQVGMEFGKQNQVSQCQCCPMFQQISLYCREGFIITRAIDDDSGRGGECRKSAFRANDKLGLISDMSDRGEERERERGQAFLRVLRTLFTYL